MGSPIQAPLDALESLRKKHPFEAGQVKQLTVRIATDEAAVVITATSRTSACNTCWP